ncbi:MAG TPA: hypothetical protein VGD67_13470 [Pseudonocardiaceae bacterium]
MSTRLRLLATLLSALGFLGPALPAHATLGPTTVSIAQARALPLGTIVTVTGTATTPSGAFESSFFDQGFAMQDLTAGIYVSVPTSLGIGLRTRVRVTGTLRDSFGLRILVPADAAAVTTLGQGLPVLPTLVRTADVSEATEGRLVRVLGRITRPPASDLPYGHKFYVDDGSGELTIFVNLQAAIDLTRLGAGDLVLVSGFSSQFDDHYEIDPRFPADVIVLHR